MIKKMNAQNEKPTLSIVPVPYAYKNGDEKPRRRQGKQMKPSAPESPLSLEKSIIRTRAQKRREAMAFHYAMLTAINDFYSKEDREPSSADNTAMGLYIEHVRQLHASDQLHADYLKLVKELAPWLELVDEEELEEEDEDAAIQKEDNACMDRLISFLAVVLTISMVALYVNPHYLVHLLKI
jgi:hypothetical protein